MAETRSKMARVATADRRHPTRVTMPIAAADSEPVAAPRMSQSVSSRVVISRATLMMYRPTGRPLRPILGAAASRRPCRTRADSCPASVAPTVKVGLPHFMPKCAALIPERSDPSKPGSIVEVHPRQYPISRNNPDPPPSRKRGDSRDE